VILNPFDARSAKWDVFAELRNPYDVDELAQAFIPDRGSDPTWTGFARTLFSAVTRQAQTAGIRGDMGGKVLDETLGRLRRRRVQRRNVCRGTGASRPNQVLAHIYRVPYCFYV